MYPNIPQMLFCERLKRIGITQEWHPIGLKLNHTERGAVIKNCIRSSTKFPEIRDTKARWEEAVPGQQ